MPMCFNMQRRAEDRVLSTDVPRRKPAPRGVVTAVQRTAVGPLDSVLDTSLNATRHAAISRNWSNRNLVESQPHATRAQKHRFDDIGSRVATFSHLKTATLTQGDEIPPTPCVRGRRQVAPPPVSRTPRLAKPGRRVFPPQPTSAPDTVKKATHEGAAPDRSTPNLLKFSPRAGSTAQRSQMMAQKMQTLRARRSSGMMGALTWSTTPRKAMRPTPQVSAPYDATLPQKLTSTTTSSFRRPQTAPTPASPNTLAATNHVRRTRCTQRVLNRPKTARGLLTWE